MFKCLILSCVLTVLAMSTAVSNAGPITYEFFNPGLSNGYSFTGTITTDGSTGSFSVLAPIITDFEIALTTPSANDGVFDETLTFGSAFIIENEQSEFLYKVTPTEIILRDSLTVDKTIQFFDSEVVLSFFNNAGALPKQSQIRDVSEVPDVGFASLGEGDLIIANNGMDAAAVPEPNSLALIAIGAAGVAAWRLRKKSKPLLKPPSPNPKETHHVFH